jgi:hypothetical protein
LTSLPPPLDQSSSCAADGPQTRGVQYHEYVCMYASSVLPPKEANFFLSVLLVVLSD